MNSSLIKQQNCCITVDVSSPKRHNLDYFTCKICLNKYVEDSSTSSITSTTNLSSSTSASSSTTSASSSSFDINSILNSDENDELLMNAMSEHDYDTLSSFKSPISLSSIYQIQSCKCKFCINCLKQYIKQCIANCDVCPINCPDSICKLKGSFTKSEVKYLILASTSHLTFESENQNTISNNNNDNSKTDSNNNKMCFIDYETVITINENNDKEALLSTASNTMLNLDKNEIDCKKSRLNLYKQYLNMYKNNEILRDPTKVHCSRPNCQNVCSINFDKNSKQKYNYLKKTKVTCDKCHYEFCSVCFKKWSTSNDKSTFQASQLKEILNSLNNTKTPSKKYSFLNKTNLSNLKSTIECDCEIVDFVKLMNRKKNSQNDVDDDDDITNNNKTKPNDDLNKSNQNFNNNTKNFLINDFENIKRCPKCSILIERADGCAQIMCKACRHTFCFYCLTSLDDDFLLKHFTKNGPCKGKLGHSRLSLFLHRLSVVSIFLGTIILVIILSPFILISLPCLVFSNKCRKTCLKFSAKFN